MYSTRLFLSILVKLEFSRIILEKTLKYQTPWKFVQSESSCSMQTDGQTDMAKLIVAYRSFAYAIDDYKKVKIC